MKREMQKIQICPVCQDDGWYASPSFADLAKKTIRIRKVACPNGCPNKDNEPGVQPLDLPVAPM